MTQEENKALLSAAISFPDNNVSLRKQAEKLATLLQLPMMPALNAPSQKTLFIYTSNGLELHYHDDIQGKLYIDFKASNLNYRIKHGGGIKQALARAVGIKANIRPCIVDATAGLGIDSYLLADLGCEVLMIERSPFLAALLADALERIESNKLSLLQGEAVTLIARPENSADTIYLDPMYPHRNKSALNKQEMRIIRKLVGDDEDADEVFLTAIQHAKKRVVVKRPKGAPQLCNRPPSHVIKMKNSRFDVYMT